MKAKAIIVLGPPGAGKGTQAELIAEKFNLYHWETSEIIGRMIEKAKKGEFIKAEGEKYYFEQEKKIREEGKLWDPPFIIYLVKEKIKELAKEEKGIALVGSPRTLYEGEKIIPLLKELYGRENIKVIFLKLSARESIWRNSHRKTCELMDHTLLYTKETIRLKKCPFDGSKLSIRKDDNPKIIKTRLKEFKEKTLPLIDYFKNEKIKIIKIDGSPPPAVIFKNILKFLK